MPLTTRHVYINTILICISSIFS